MKCARRGAGLVCIFIFCSTWVSFSGEDVSDGETFLLGEKLLFRVIFLGAPAGTASLEVRGMKNIKDTQVFHFVATARSSAVFSLFYTVRDRVESFVRPETFLPVRFEKHLIEGPHYRKSEVTEFDHVRKTARADSKEFSIPSDIQDSLSSLYYLRMQQFKVGKSIFVNVNADEKNYRVEVEALREEKVKKWGKLVDTIVVKPILKDVRLGGVLKERGDIYIWLTDDEKKIPVHISAQVGIGQLSFVLVDYEKGKKREADKKQIKVQ